MSLSSATDGYSLVIFDLDDCLYVETDFLFPAYQQIAQAVQQRFGVSSKLVFHFLSSTFVEHGRKNLFNKLIDHFSLSSEALALCLESLRSYSKPNSIFLDQSCENLLTALARKTHISICVLTNGNVVQQKNKVASLKWNKLETQLRFYFANEIAPKPSPKAVHQILLDTTMNKENAVLIGDSDIDQETASNANIAFVRHLAQKRV